MALWSSEQWMICCKFWPRTLVALRQVMHSEAAVFGVPPMILKAMLEVYSGGFGRGAFSDVCPAPSRRYL